MAPFDIVCLSRNDDPRYAQFVPLVEHAWSRFFPEVDVAIAHTPGASPATAKLARYRLAGMLSHSVCLIHDIDTVPLQRDYYVRLTEQRRPGHLLCVGREVYDGTPHEGKFPAGCMTGEGELFRRLLPPGLCPASRVFDDKEDPSDPSGQFSDESLIRARLSITDIPRQYEPREVDIYRDWVDRSWWHLLDVDRLRRGEYVECNMLRPWSENREAMQPIVDFLEYEGPMP